MSFIVYKSSAGSGKTYTIVKEYLSIVLVNPSKFRRILAITFTNKAANEMKERVLLFLKHLSNPEKYKDGNTIRFLLPQLVEECKLDSDEIVLNAQKVQSLILHNYADFAISTIDSFVHKIIRTFALDLKLPMNFEVELDANAMIDKVVDYLLTEVGINQDLSRVLIQFISSKTDQDKSWNPEKDIAKFVHSVLDEDGLRQLKKLKQLEIKDFFEISKKIEINHAKLSTEIQLKAQSCMDLFRENGIEATHLYQGKRGIFGYFERIAKGDYTKPELNTYANDTLFNDRWFSKKADDSIISAIEGIRFNVLGLYKELNDLFSKFFLYHVLRKNIYPVALINEIEKILDDLRIQNNLIHISEFNKRITEVIRQEPIPFIYERIGEKYNHYLIDEFQDTSLLQWQNLLPLVENSLSYSNKNLIVGDGKQAIYRWRAGDVEQFAKLPYLKDNEGDPVQMEREDVLIRSFEERFLDKNYRSKTEIVSFNNDFFDHCATFLPDNLKSIYHKSAQESDLENTGGKVQISFSDDDKEIEDRQFQLIKSQITECLNDGYSYSDIAVLVRSNKKGTAIADYLIGENIPIISSESLLLRTSAKVQFLISFMKYLINPSNQQALVQVMFFLGNHDPNLKVDYSILRELIYKEKEESYALMSHLISNGYKINLKALLLLSVYDLSEALIAMFNLEEEPDIFLQQYLDQILELSGRKKAMLSEIPNWWEERGQFISISVPEGVDAVRIMTVHKSKGLEFSVVIYPFAYEKSILATKDNAWADLDIPELPELRSSLLELNKDLLQTDFDNLYVEEEEKSLLDRLNVLYVALTRPTQRLYINSRFTKSKGAAKRIEEFLLGYCLAKEGEQKEVYQFGEGDEVKSSESKEQTIALKGNELSGWMESLEISFQARQIWDDEQDDSSAKWGTLVHRILSEVENAPMLKEIIYRYHIQGLLNEVEAKELEMILHYMIMHPLLHDFYTTKYKIYNEAEIICPNGEVYRPDRLMLGVNEAIHIIDYKTGKPHSEHRDQINTYGKVLESMEYQEIHKYLVYLDKEINVIKVTSDE
jgi:ATP-dependent exoDNAse (exonuclease V) beta subunit